MNSKDYTSYVNKIISSKSFGNSTTYANLLRYLVQCTLEDDVPKETTIATEIFAKKEFDPSQSTLIRVYVYNLRKKLKAYYQNEGLNDPILLRVPKGSYKVEFETKKKTPKESNGLLSRKQILLLLGFLLLTSVIGNWILYRNNKSVDQFSDSVIWNGIFNSKKPMILVLGDLFIYREIDTSSHREKVIRNALINAETQLYDSLPKIGSEGYVYEPMEYSFLIRNSTEWVKDISKVLTSKNKDFNVRTVLRFGPKELPENDFMVVGMAKTLGIFKDYIEKSSVKYNPLGDTFSPKGSDTIYRPSGDAQTYHKDYAIIIKAPGPNNNAIYVFAGLWDTGASQSLKNFTNPVLIKQLESRMKTDLGDIPQFFEVFMEVNGIDRMELSSKIIHVKALELD
ncbi:hypothetical protein [Zobellia sp. 1_MG-2023]|uniref:hypothetical protein n=1 Tax=Zobellia sp. 1_MG-2023 TaxID=3062626 RepID=UPI0026E42AB8|nr:hypothetical protein [Zobellia sp. 1_MG-2023]MDO6820668.1 hypothetical protein [Zobellia sp. 1_MG-2023]